MGFFSTRVDMRSRKSMQSFLQGHFRYDTLNSWNNITSYANRVKIHQLGLSAEQRDRAYALLDPDSCQDISDPIADFTTEMNGRYTIGFNGRSGGYLVLYQSQYESTGHQSFCPCCGQRNFRKVLETPEDKMEATIASTMAKSNAVWRTETYQELPEVQALCLSDEASRLIIDRWRTALKDGDFSNQCGACHAVGENGRRNYRAPPKRLVTQTTGIDESLDFDEVSLSELRSKVKLVQRFDQACEDIRTLFIAQINDALEQDREDESAVNLPPPLACSA